MVDYICYRCYYKTSRKSNIDAHLKRVIKCPLINNISDNEIKRLNEEQFEKKRMYIGLKSIRRLYNSISFEDDDWFINHISEMDKFILLFSSIMYSKLLEKILENDLNYNVIIDIDYGIGLIITGKKDVYKRIDCVDINLIVEKTINKLEENLLTIYKQFEEKYKEYECGDILNKIKDGKNINNLKDEIIKIYGRYYDNVINKINERKKIGY
jgi:hypothetical protein